MTTICSIIDRIASIASSRSSRSSNKLSSSATRRQRDLQCFIENRFVVSLCHGPAAFLAVGDSDIYRGYKICAFPDALDAQTPDIGYMPGHLTWKFGEKLKALGFEILNEGISGAAHQDRKLLTGDNPLAGNALGKLAADAILKEVGAA